MAQTNGPAGVLAAPAAEFRRAWDARRPHQTVAWVIGFGLIASGLAHLGVFAVDGGPWAGPLSWRKPVTFGLSFGLTTVTLAWIAGLLRPRRLLSLAVLAVAFGSLLEVALVTMQTWRGVPSHFNDGTPFDAGVFSLMGLTVAVIATGILVITAFAFGRIDAGPAMIIAIRTGLLILLASQALGAAIIANGFTIDRGPTETDLAIFGAAGVMKIPHAVTVHAIQVLPVLAVMLAATSLPPARRRQVMWFAAAAYTGLVLASALQTFSGRAPLDLSTWSIAVVGLSAALAGLALFGLAAGAMSGKPGNRTS